MREITFVDALNEALHEEMERDPKVFVIGEDVELAYVFGVTKGLAARFGKERVRDTPISELGIVGAGVGAAMAGYRPVIEIMFMDFIMLAMDPLINQAAKLRYMLGGQISVPMVVRTPGGGGVQYGPTHSQCLEAWFMQMPGIKVAVPSNPADGKGLLKAAIRDDNPVLFVEHKMLYKQKGLVPEGEHLVPFGKAEVKRPGSDVTLVGVGYQVVNCLRAAEALAGEGISAEVVDPRTLAPLDTATLAESVRKTGRCVVVEEGHLRSGVGSEIAAAIQAEAFDYLDAPIGRIAALDAPIPFEPRLEEFVLPSPGKIVKAAKEAVGAAV
ncbi:MAG: alpha-ketoacid dehydrogenase subunit beta [Candidatus Tectomicrobia bacterium]|uniref:Alpha-ketoacid dehydrogenase subunit beta n=1 Tax=Tectimicrobiota bacterium TaxID=2528274 RepID=A0A932HXI6_UNCTE|nr:alpha-ketoacid dehydrogenase subunit beta [Candidatus Tectomicrobia bacterium]